MSEESTNVVISGNKAGRRGRRRRRRRSDHESLRPLGSGLDRSEEKRSGWVRDNIKRRSYFTTLSLTKQTLLI